MALSTVFPSRARVRPPFTSIGQGARFIEVTTEDQLLQALTPIDATNVAELIAMTGRRIVMAAPITLKAPVEVAIPGATIECHGKVPLFCGKDGIDAFIVTAPQVTISGLLITSPNVTGNAATETFGTAVTFKDGADGGRVLDVDTFGCAALVYGESGVDDVMVRGCDVLVTSGANADCVTINGRGWRVMGNLLDGSGTGQAIVGDTSSERCAIVGNDCNGDDIDMSAGLGSNTISANTNAGTVTGHGTDDTGGGNT